MKGKKIKVLTMNRKGITESDKTIHVEKYCKIRWLVILLAIQHMKHINERSCASFQLAESKDFISHSQRIEFWTALWEQRKNGTLMQDTNQYSPEAITGGKCKINSFILLPRKPSWVILLTGLIPWATPSQGPLHGPPCPRVEMLLHHPPTLVRSLKHETYSNTNLLQGTNQ